MAAGCLAAAHCVSIRVSLPFILPVSEIGAPAQWKDAVLAAALGDEHVDAHAFRCEHDDLMHVQVQSTMKHRQYTKLCTFSRGPLLA
eukprot:6203624-Pleurochrysis_carterae.AAC.1